jgi:hypothetical protein
MVSRSAKDWWHGSTAFTSKQLSSTRSRAILTAAGLAFPIGPIALAGSVTVASTVHSDKGPLDDAPRRSDNFWLPTADSGPWSVE